MPFELPSSAQVNLPIHKKELEDKLRGKHRKTLSEGIQRIDWLYKLSTETTNVPSGGIQELQVIQVQLKKRESVLATLIQLDKQIPYPIIWVQRHENAIILSTSVKHVHPLDNAKMVIDHTFSTEWLDDAQNHYSLTLYGTLEEVYARFCQSFSLAADPPTALADQIVQTKEIEQLQRRVQQLEAKIKACKQFNKKVELNRELREVKNKLSELK